MRFLIGFVFILILAFPLHYFMPWWWWSAIVPAILFGFGLQMKAYLSFLCGLLWWAFFGTSWLFGQIR